MAIFNCMFLFIIKYEKRLGTSLVVQWLRLCAPNAGGPGSIPGQGSRSHMQQLRARMPQLKKKKKDPACRREDPVCGN